MSSVSFLLKQHLYTSFTLTSLSMFCHLYRIGDFHAFSYVVNDIDFTESNILF